MSNTTSHGTSSDLSARTRAPRRTITATPPLLRWRTIDLLTCAFLGVAFGVAYWAWGLVYAAPSNAVSAVFPPLGALLNWPWLVAGIVGMLIIRRPGAAVFTEVLAAVVSALIGTQWGWTTLVSGLVQGLGVELGFALFGYAVYRWAPLLIGGFLGGAFEAVYEWYSYWTDWGWGYKIAYLFLLGGSVAVFGSLLALGLTSALAQAGALGAFPPGQEARERQAVA
ncbi:ABC transporter permease [Intrasporangium oryzae NRRL B-24470]|uniref:ABC transporter permease n=1 Tax=Intrasporangium oryzae NRRL B-24470 TaxID=1386089 RepID=W9G624_9MICO|nr:ECF transporter S component [Intrasporangium oryzae]EWT00762.1 ABC transporter permease [Intrasporangium oryzae NRRL B-24470]